MRITKIKFLILIYLLIYIKTKLKSKSDDDDKITVDEIPSPSSYYDGERKLNIIPVTCQFYSNRSFCLNQSGCGWCGERNTCVSGNQFGPTEPCLSSTYVFTTGPPRMERIVQETVGPLSATIIDHAYRH